MAKKTIVLKVGSDDGDYGALIFEGNPCTVSDFVRQIRDSGGNCLDIFFEFPDQPDMAGHISGELVEFEGDIPQETWGLIRDHLQDEDQAKHENFYWVEVVDVPSIQN